MLRVWWPAFAAAGFVEMDFRAAMALLVTSENVPNWPREHLAAVNRELRSARAERERRGESKQEETRDGERCRLCGWTGWVVVPHPVDVRGGEWVSPYHTCAVACTRCGPGRRMYEQTASAVGEKKAPLTLDHYELRFDCAWVEHLAEHANAVKLMLRAENETEAVKKTAMKKTATKITRETAAGFAMPPEERPSTANDLNRKLQTEKESPPCPTGST